MSLLIFTAPPGWGKTQKIIEWHQENEASIVYISPLRALTDEFHKRCHGLKRVYRPIDTNNWQTYFKCNKNSLLIVTAEELNEERCDLVINKRALFIIDEIHLFYYWGESFRFKIFELWMKLAAHDCDVVVMTATMEIMLKQKILQDALCNFNEIYQFDQGLNQFQNNPHQALCYPKQKWIHSEIQCQLKKPQTYPILVFVAYRSQVERWLSWADKNSIRAIGCVGGEAKTFTENIGREKWQLIVATSVLSHGVNLPVVSHVFLTYSIEVTEFWYQMAGRGGRRGETFTLHHMNKKLRGQWSSVVPLYLKYLKNRCFQSMNSML